MKHVKNRFSLAIRIPFPTALFLSVFLLIMTAFGSESARAATEIHALREGISVKAPLLTGQGLFPETHDQYLAVTLAFEPLKDLLKVVQDLNDRPLISRGEAHVTVITPPEFERMKAYITIGDLNRIARNYGLQDASVRPVCVGRGGAEKNGVMEQTYYIVVDAEAFSRARKAVRNLLDRRGVVANVFNPSAYHPHVTLGFTQDDLFDADGVIKDEQSCVLRFNQ